jgi:hypothetical protein
MEKLMTELLTLDDLSSVFDQHPESKAVDSTWYKEYMLDGVPFWARANKTHFEFSISGFPSLIHSQVCLGSVNISRKKSLEKVKKEVQTRLINDTIKEQYAEILKIYQKHLEYTKEREFLQAKIHKILDKSYNPKGYNNDRVSNNEKGIKIEVLNNARVNLTFELHPYFIEKMIEFRESL